VVVLFVNIITAYKVWNALLTRYERNIQNKKTKLTDLEIKFENLRIDDSENLEDMYTMFMYI
jgi:hypothetical protein